MAPNETSELSQEDPHNWGVDGSSPIVTPGAALSYYRQLMGGTVDLPLPDLLVATFQATALRHMAGVIGTEVVDRWPTPIFWPLAHCRFREREMAIARLPIGAPAAAGAIELMISAGVRTILLVGSVGSLQPDLPTGSLVIATSAVRSEGTSYHYLAAGEAAHASPDLVDALVSVVATRDIAAASGPVWTTDAPYRECAATVARLRGEGVLGVEMEAAALFAVSLHRGARVALIAAVSDELGDEWHPGFHTLAYRRAILTAADVALDAAFRASTTPFL